MSLERNQLIIIGAIGLIVIIFVLIFLKVIPGRRGTTFNPASVAGTINFWGVFDPPESYNEAIRIFAESYPNVTINYRRFNDFKNYKRTLLNALAAGEGPDIFMIGSNMLPQEINKLVPAPPDIFSIHQLHQSFPQVVEQDFTSKGAIYALPLYLDTLVLFYNRDLLNSAKIATPPKTWEEFKDAVSRLTVIDKKTGQIIRSGAAIGSARNVNRAFDILSLLMLQTGTKMVSDNFSSASFNSPEGLNALEFYTQFADSKSQLYTWDSVFPEAIQAFTEEKTAMIFDYASAITEIKARNPFLNFGIAEMPQPAEAAKKINYSRYFGYAVSKQSAYPNTSWNFIIKMVTEPSSIRNYIQLTRRPPAYLPAINQYLSDPDFTIFAGQALTARSWPQIDSEKIEEIFLAIIDFILTGVKSPAAALGEAQAKVTELMAPKEILD